MTSSRTESSSPTLSVQAATGGAGPARRDGKKWRILVVDDNPDVVTVVRRILASQGYESLAAGDGTEALEIARREMPDLVLLDWMLPGLDGLEVCRQLKGDPETRGIMIILVTGRGSVDNRVQGFDAGADDYIPKPFSHPELLARIRSALRLKRLADDLAARNRELLASQNELVRSEKMATIGLLASGIAHEFNNIMAGVSGYAQLAKRNPRYLSRLVDVALTQTERAIELTKSLSTYNRCDPDELDCDPAKVIEHTLYLVKKEVESKGIRLETKLAPVPQVKMSPGRLQEVVLNLALNAVHAVAERGRIVITTSRLPGGRVEIRVEDNGEGIPEENLHRIFDPFFTTKGALGGGKQSGVGLGLSVCYNLVQSHGGQISVESQAGRGSTFTVTLPESPAREEPPEGKEGREPAGVPPAPQRPLRVLVTDDEGPIREMLTEFLEGHQVRTCTSGDEAIEICSREKFDYVILDIYMSNSLNGVETLKVLKTLDPDLRVILASGRLPKDLKAEDLELAYAHLLKPFKLEAISALLGLPPGPADRSLPGDKKGGEKRPRAARGAGGEPKNPG